MENKIILFHHSLEFLFQKVYDRHNLKVDDGLKKDIYNVKNWPGTNI